MPEKEKPQRVVSWEMICRDRRSPILIVALILFLASICFSLPGVVKMFDEEASIRFMLLLGVDYIDAGAALSWLIVRNLISSLGLIVPLLMSVGIILTLLSSGTKRDPVPMWGLEYFHMMAKISRVVLWVVMGLLALLFVFRAVRYMIINGSQIGGILFIFAMLLPECVFACVVAIALALFTWGIYGMVHTLDNIRLNCLTGRPECYGLKGSAAFLMVLTAIAAAVLCGVNWSEWWTAVCFGCSAAAHVFMAIWLHWYRRKTAARALEQYRADRLKQKA